tara:strand:+ start:682 stop:909 length:228 start_codon:yes stop_codon:yes gene_type:complete
VSGFNRGEIMFRKTDEKTKNKVIELEEKIKSLETKLTSRMNELEIQLLELAVKQKRDDGFFKMVIETIKEWKQTE